MSSYRDVSNDIHRVEMDDNQRKLLTSTLSDLEDEVKFGNEVEEEMIKTVDDAYDDYKKEYAKSLEIKFPKIKPLGNTIILSSMLMNMMEQGKFLMNGDMNVDMVESFGTQLSEVQYVVAAGKNCTEVRVGDKVTVRFSDFFRVINPNSANRKEEFQIDTEVIDGVRYVFCHEGNIKYVHEGENIKGKY